jgi:RIO-like serine/threonine protein kinase
MMLDTFSKELRERFPDYTTSKIGSTRHSNVLRLSKDGHPPFVAKTIWHDSDEPDGEMGIAAQDKAYDTEVNILKMLPKWWGIHLVDNFKTSLNRIIVTTEVIHVPWKSYEGGTNDVAIAKGLFDQIQWLHSQGISHNDLELKNILLTESYAPIIIDFEKSTLPTTKEQMNDDYRKLLANMREHENTASIATMLDGMKSKGGTRSSRRRRTRRRNRKTRSRNKRF